MSHSLDIMQRFSLKIFAARLVLAWLFTYLFLPDVYAETLVTAGMLTKDTTWTGEVVVDGLVEVNAGVTLKLQPGTSVCFKASSDGIEPSSGLVVYGTLNAVGEQDKPIQFYGETRQPGSWQGLSLKMGKGAPSVMRHCRVEDALTGIFGYWAELLAEKVELVGNTTGITADNGFKMDLRGSRVALNGTGLLFLQNVDATVYQSRIELNHDAGLVLKGSTPEIKYNVIEGNGPVGISCHRGSNPEISDNQIAGNDVGIVAERMSSPNIMHNEIRNNGIGVSFGRMTFSFVEYNLINRNDVGIFCSHSSYPEIHHNNLQGNRDYALDLGTNHSLLVYQKKSLQPRSGEFSYRSGPLKMRKFDNVSGQPIYIPDDGLVQASNNWWGSLVTDEMNEYGTDANISVFEDYYDEKTMSFKGQAYERDRFGYAPWLDSPPEKAGPRVLPTANMAALVELEDSTRE